MTEIANAAESLVGQFDDHLDLDAEDLEDEMEGLIADYSLPVSEAKTIMRNKLLDEAGIDRTDDAPPVPDSSEFSPVDIETIQSEGDWVDIRANVVQLWTPNSSKIKQVGLLGDESDVIKFTIFAGTDVPELEKGHTYHLSNVVTDEYQGRYSVKIREESDVTIAEDDEIEYAADEESIEGVLYAVKSGSGLIKRCPEDDCSRVVSGGTCADHGNVEGEPDLRIKAVVDNGFEAHDVVFNEQATTEFTGMTLDDALEIASDALDYSAVERQIKSEVVGQFVHVSGPILGRYLVVNDAEQVSGITDEMVSRLQSEQADTQSPDQSGTSAEASA